MKKTRIIFTFLSIALLFAIISGSVAAQVRTPGVNVGDTFTYGNMSFTWYSDDPSATPPGEWEGMNETESMSVEVISVVGTNITGTLTSHLKNGTQETEDGWVDVETGEGSSLILFFVSANLNVNDSVYSSGNYSMLTITETSMTTYPEGERETNHANMTVDFSMPPTSMYMSINVYWDRATGALTQMSMVMNQTMGGYTTDWSVSLEMTGASSWVVPEFSGVLQTLLLLGSLTLVTLAHRRRLHKMRNH